MARRVVVTAEKQRASLAPTLPPALVPSEPQAQSQSRRSRRGPQKRIAVPIRGAHPVVTIVGGPADIYLEVKRRLARYGIWAKHHWECNVHRSGGLPRDVDCVLVLKDFVGHALHNEAVMAADALRLPLIGTQSKWSQMYGALAQRGLFAKAWELGPEALRDRHLEQVEPVRRVRRRRTHQEVLAERIVCELPLLPAPTLLPEPPSAPPPPPSQAPEIAPFAATGTQAMATLREMMQSLPLVPSQEDLLFLFSREIQRRLGAVKGVLITRDSITFEMDVQKKV